MTKTQVLVVAEIEVPAGRTVKDVFAEFLAAIEPTDEFGVKLRLAEPVPATECTFTLTGDEDEGILDKNVTVKQEGIFLNIYPEGFDGMVASLKYEDGCLTMDVWDGEGDGEEPTQRLPICPAASDIEDPEDNDTYMDQ